MSDRRSKMTPDTLDAARKAHAKGLNNKEIAATVGVCTQTVTKILGELGLKSNGKPGRKPGQARAQSSVPKEEA